MADRQHAASASSSSAPAPASSPTSCSRSVTTCSRPTRSTRCCQYLRLRHPDCRTAVASAETIPVATRTVDVVVSAQAFHWFDVDTRTARDRARAQARGHPRPGVELARRPHPLGAPARPAASTRRSRSATRPNALIASRLFGYVEERRRSGSGSRCASTTCATWSCRAPTSRSRRPTERERVLRQVDSLYDEYDRGPDGLLMPYVTQLLQGRRTTRGPRGVRADPPRPRRPPEPGETEPGRATARCTAVFARLRT